MNIEDYAKMLREQLFQAFFEWLDTNKATIGGKWYNNLWKQGVDAKAECNTPGAVMGYGMWMLNMITNLGVSAGVSINDYSLHGVAQGINEQASRKLLALIGCSFTLQFIPNKEFPIISSKHFSLQEWGKRKGIPNEVHSVAPTSH
jgi:hypothetical protein